LMEGRCETGKVFIPFMSWFEVKEALDEGKDLVLIPCGSNEQHGPHRPTGDDWIFAWEVSVRVAEKMGNALVAPPLTVGVAPYHMEWPGTITIPIELHKELVKHVVKSLWKHGFKRFVLLNTHGGNRLSLQAAMYELKEEIPDLKIVYSDFWGQLTRDFVEIEIGIPYEKLDHLHGGGFQTSCMMAIEAKYNLKLVDKSKAPPAPKRISSLRARTSDQVAAIPLYGKALKEYSDGTGVMYNLDESNVEANAEDGERFLDILTSNLAKKLKNPETWLL
jgi:creatinine amidohydrolase